MPRVNFVKAARKDYPEQGIKKGESYYHWAFAFGPKYKSKTPPKRQQLTRSSFQIGVYDIEDAIAALQPSEDVATDIESIIGDIQNLKDEVQSSLDNMPQQLQDADTGQLLQERIEALENWENELDSIDKEIDTEDLKEQTKQEIAESVPSKDFETVEVMAEYADAIEQVYQGKLNERAEEIIQEVQNISCEI